MNIGVNKVFLKELSKIPVKERRKVEKLLFEEIETFSSFTQIPNFKKLKGYRNYYKIRFGDYRAGLKFENNTLYFDSLAISGQDKNTASISSFSLAKDYKLLNFYFRTAFIYQLTSNQILFPLPEMIGRQVAYYQKYIFKGALKFQMGAGVSYSTGYYGYAYMPALTEFYVQNNTKLGYYPKLDVFINIHLKRAQLFLKYEHFNAGKSLHKSYAVSGYPPMSKSLKFGISWNLFD